MNEKFKELKINLRYHNSTKRYHGFVDGDKHQNIHPIRSKMENEFVSMKKAVIMMYKKFIQQSERFNSLKLIDLKCSKMVFPVQITEFEREIEQL